MARQMNSGRATTAFRIGFSAAAAVLVLAGASLSASGRDLTGLALAGVASLLALAAGVGLRTWKLAAPLIGASLVLTLVLAQHNPTQGDLVLQLASLLFLAAG